MPVVLVLVILGFGLHNCVLSLNGSIDMTAAGICFYVAIGECVFNVLMFYDVMNV